MSSDCYKGRVYFIKMLNLFHTIDYRAAPRQGSWVVVERLGSGEVLIERYRGQQYLAVVRFLKPLAWLPQQIALLSTLGS